MSSTPAAELAAIVEKLCWAEAAEADLARLDVLLAAHPDLWPAYQDAVHLHVCLRHRFAGAVTTAPVRSRFRRFGWVAGALAALAAGLALLLAPPPGTRAAPAATVTALLGQLASGDGDGANGRVRLVTGLAEVTFQSGAVVILEGPAELNAEAPHRGVLVSGRASVKVPASAGRFAVDTPAGQVSDGPADAEFGIDVGTDGATVVQVYGGAVEAGGRPITAGDAVRFAATESSPVPFISSRFVREMPPFETRPGTGNDQKQ
ncbi:MAG: hypothetical protein U0792_23040, partial [Gemmataceae bacterium]